MSAINIFKGLYVRNTEIRNLMKSIHLLINDSSHNVNVPVRIIELIQENKKAVLDLVRIGKRIKQHNDKNIKKISDLDYHYRKIESIHNQITNLLHSTMESTESIKDKHTSVYWGTKPYLKIEDDDYDYTQTKTRRRKK